MSEGEKTEAPTPKRLRDAEKRGDLLTSRDLGAALVMGAGAVWLSWAGAGFVDASARMLARGLTFDRGALERFDVGAMVARALLPLAPTFAPLLAMAVAAALASTLLLGRLKPHWGALAFKEERVDPLKGLRRIFGAQGAIELGKLLLKVGLVGALGAWVAAGAADAAGQGVRDASVFARSFGAELVEAMTLLVVGLLLIALVDAPLQAMRRTQRLRMTRQEVRDEAKQADGSPETKAQQRRRRHELLSASARRGVAEATVVLTNPIHIAVALRYRQGEDAAPVVVARGKGATAEAVRLLAAEASVPVLPYPELARAVYFSSREGQVINEALFRAVAVVLAFVLRMDAKAAATPPQVEVPAELRFDSEGRRQGARHA